MRKEGISRCLTLTAIITLLILLMPGSAPAPTSPTVEVKAWLYETQNTYDRTDDDTLSPAGSDSAGFYWENNIDATGGPSNPAWLNSNNSIWDVYSDASTLYRLVFQFQADAADLKFTCQAENDGYWFVDNSDGYWSYADASGTKELLTEEKLANEDVTDTSGAGSSQEDYRIAQSFVATGEVLSVQIYGKKPGTTQASAILRIETDNSGEPSGSLVSSDAVDTVSASTFGTSLGWVSFAFSSPIPLKTDTTYHIVLRDDVSMDNIPICQASNNQSDPEIVSDGYHGAIITWEDRRGGANYDIYVQRVDSLGDTLWSADGVAVCQASDNEYDPVMVSDGYHGAIITWEDQRSGNYDIYVQRVDSLGNMVWTANGVAVCQASGNQYDPMIVTDGYHGAIITWYDYRSDTADIFAQRVDSLGNVKWSADGVAISQAADDQRIPMITSDGCHGAIITWQDYRNGTADIYAQRVDSLGNVKWTADGVALCDATDNQEHPSVVRDGHQGAIVTWHDHRGSDYDIYAQRVDSLGNAVWTANGVVVSQVSGNQYYPTILSDGYQGAMIAWEDYRNGNYDIYAQRVDSLGNAVWTAGGVAVCQAAQSQDDPTMVSDGYHGAIITWFDKRGVTYSDIYVQRVDSLGNAKWAANGVALCSARDSQRRPMIASDDCYGALVCWQDYRNGSTNHDVYVDGVDSLGNIRWGKGSFDWAYEAADYSDGEMLDRSSGSASWTHYADRDLLFKFPASLITDHKSGWWSDPNDMSHQYAPDVGNDITRIDTDKRLECIDATRNWEADAYDGINTLYAGTDSTLIWESFFRVDEDWTDNDTINLHLYVNKRGGGHTTDIAFKLQTTSSKLKWKYPSSGSIGGIVSSPTIRGGRVWVGSDDAKLYCLDVSDGSLIWTYSAGDTIRSSPSAAYESGDWVVYFGANDGYVYAVRDTGSSWEEKWKKDLGAVVGSCPALWDSLLYVGCEDDSIHCLRLSDGTQRWATYLYGDISSSPAVHSDNAVYIGSKSDTLYALNCIDGTVLRRYRTCGDIVAPIFVTYETGRLCAGSCVSQTPGSDTMYVINSSNFSTYWKFADSGNLAGIRTSGFCPGTSNLYFGSDNNCLYSINPSDSTLAYKYDTQGDVRSSPLYWNGTVYFGSNSGSFYAFDDSNQQPKTGWPFISNDKVESSPAISLTSGIVVVGSSDGHVYAFNLE